MEEVRYHQMVSRSLIDRGMQFLDRLNESRFPLRLLRVAGGIALAGVSMLHVVPQETASSEMQNNATDCVGSCEMVPGVSVLGEAVTIDNVSPPTSEAQPSPLEVPHIEGVHPAVNERMRAMQINPEGMTSFLTNLDVSQQGFIKTLAEFNPLFNKKPRAVMDQVTLHTMAGYYDDIGRSETPRGPFNIQTLAKGMAASFGDVLKGRGSCCGVQSAISRDAHTYLLTGMNDPVQHNIPYDSSEFGIEIEAFWPPEVKTAQWEQAGYMSILKLRLAGITDPGILVSKIAGHGQRRQELYQEYHTTSKWKSKYPTFELFKEDYPYKGDVLGPESELFRRVLLRALLLNPDLMTMPLPKLG